jgi:hypothetical protein
MSTLGHCGLPLGFARDGEFLGKLTALSSAERLGTVEGVNGENLLAEKATRPGGDKENRRRQEKP